MLTLNWLTLHAGNISAGKGRGGRLATPDLLGAKADATRVGTLHQGKLAYNLTAAGLSHADLEKKDV